MYWKSAIGTVVLSAAILAPIGLAYDRTPVTITGLTPDLYGQSITKAQTQLKGRFPGISSDYCVGVLIPGDSNSSWVSGLTRYWDKLVCAGYTYTTGKTIFTLIFDGKGPESWIIYRLRNMTISALQDT